MEEYDSRAEMQSTITDIDSFEQRLQLKTFQEGLKHKAASVDITPAIVEEAMVGGIADYRAKFQVVEPDEAPSQQESESFDAPPVELPIIATESSGVSLAPTAAEGERRLLVLEILHASDLRGPDLDWKTGVSAVVCHPFCLVLYRMQMARGKTIRSSRNPVFRDTMTLQNEGEADTLVGSIEVDVDSVIESDPKSATDGAHKWVELQGGMSGALHVNLKVMIVGK